MLILGLTGPTGAGKGAVSALFAKYYGVPAIDTDRVYHDLLLPPSACLDELVTAFGTHILNADGTLNRPALSAIVFSDDTHARQSLLNQITHKYVLDRVREQLIEYRKDDTCAVLVDAPLLYESGFDAECDAVIAVIAPLDIRRARIIARDGLSEERAMARLNIQKPDDFYSSRARYTLINDGDMNSLFKQICTVARELGVSER